MKIEVYSDFVCPFCYMGKRKLERALKTFDHQNDIDIEYKSFELDPHADKYTGKSIHELMAMKFDKSIEQAKAMNDNVARQARAVDLDYQFDTMKPTNTLDAHRLAKYAAKKGKGNEMTERLLKAYFTDSLDIGDHETLATLAGEVGLDVEEATLFLSTEKYVTSVRADEQEAQEMDVQGVPFFVFNNKYAVSGAQPEDVFTEVLEKVWEETEKPKLRYLNPEGSETTYCTDEGCEVKKDK